MPLRPPAGFIYPGYDPLRVPDAPTIGTATGGNTQASVAFTAPTNVGGSAISAYYAVSNPGQITASGASSPVTVTGLTNGTSYTFRVWALNTFGPSPFSAASGAVVPDNPIGLFGGGEPNGSGVSNVIDYVFISTTGNATDFGDLTVARRWLAACSSSVRGVWASGFDASNASNVIDYVTIASAGNAIDFGDITGNKRYGSAGASNETRGLFAGGASAPLAITYITIDSTGNSTDFGNLITQLFYLSGCSSTTRAVFGGGYNNGTADVTNILEYVTIASLGNATDFGDLTIARQELAGCSSSTRGLFGGGFTTSASNVIDYITIASVGNAIDFGDLTVARREISSCSSKSRGLWAGGRFSNVIDYVSIASTGNAIDFGDLTVARGQLAACSNGHGGL